MHDGEDILKPASAAPLARNLLPSLNGSRRPSWHGALCAVYGEGAASRCRHHQTA